MARIKDSFLKIIIRTRKFLLFVLFVIIVSVFIDLPNLSDQFITDNYPFFPSWVLPIIFSLILVSIGYVFWGKLRESDALKSEFITVVTHKFRTPLTQIRWATESLSANLSDEDRGNIMEIERSSSHLVDLTNLLVQLSDTDGLEYQYKMRPLRIDTLIEDIKTEYERRAGLKDIKILFSGSSDKKIVADEAQIRFVIQTLLDNAISYTDSHGTINVQLKEDSESKKNQAITLSVTDSGIGLSKEELGRIFEKFWRSPEARKVDTEGMGIGLFMARRIMERQKGTLHVQSEGLNKGTTFLMKLPVEQV